MLFRSLLSSGNRDARAERDGVEQGEVLDGKGPAVLIVVLAGDRELAVAVALEIEGVPSTEVRVVSEIYCPTEEIESADPVEASYVQTGRRAINRVGAPQTVADGYDRVPLRLEERVGAECVYVLHAGIALGDDQRDEVSEREVNAINEGEVVGADVSPSQGRQHDIRAVPWDPYGIPVRLRVPIATGSGAKQ